MTEKTRVLFLCTGNSARSQMAEALLRHYGGDRFEAYSAGLEPKGIHPLTIQVLEELGLDISNQYSINLSAYLGKVHFGYLITVCSNAEERCPIFPGASVRLHWPFDDPVAFQGTEAERLAEFRRVRDQIAARIQAWLQGPGED
jgi:arsenate reductase